MSAKSKWTIMYAMKGYIWNPSAYENDRFLKTIVDYLVIKCVETTNVMNVMSINLNNKKATC